MRQNTITANRSFGPNPGRLNAVTMCASPLPFSSEVSHLLSQVWSVSSRWWGTLRANTVGTPRVYFNEQTIGGGKSPVGDAFAETLSLSDAQANRMGLIAS